MNVSGWKGFKFWFGNVFERMGPAHSSGSIPRPFEDGKPLAVEKNQVFAILPFTDWTWKKIIFSFLNVF
jgi:hypothetical protein